MSSIRRGFLGFPKPSKGLASAPATAQENNSLILLRTKIAANDAFISFTEELTDDYSEFEFRLANVVPGTTNVNMGMQMSIDAGGSWETAVAYQFVAQVLGANGVRYDSATTAAANMTTMGAAANGILNTLANGGLCMTAHLSRPRVTSAVKMMDWNGAYAGTVAYAVFNGMGIGSSSLLQNSPVNGLRFIMSSGNIASGVFSLYGRRS